MVTSQGLLIGWDLGQPYALQSTTVESLPPSVTSLRASRASQSQVGVSAQHLPSLGETLLLTPTKED